MTYPQRMRNKMDTKVEALMKVKKSGRAGELRQLVLKCLADNGPQTGRAVAELLDHSKFLSSIRARINELVKSGQVVEAGITICPVSGNHVKLYGIGSETPIKVDKLGKDLKKILDLCSKLAKRNEPRLELVAVYLHGKYGPRNVK
jgi:hypothetical protein